MAHVVDSCRHEWQTPRMSEPERWHRHNVPAARGLRRRSTPSETLLWQQLRGRRFHGFKFRRQHPIGPFVVDFYCEDLLLAIEIDGGVHRMEAVRENDESREEVLRNLGVHFVRVGSDEVESAIQSVLAEVERQLGLA